MSAKVVQLNVQPQPQKVNEKQKLIDSCIAMILRTHKYVKVKPRKQC